MGIVSDPVACCSLTLLANTHHDATQYVAGAASLPLVCSVSVSRCSLMTKQHWKTRAQRSSLG